MPDENASLYLAFDRRRALAENVALPEVADGAVLFADVSGFTALCEALARAEGARRGAEEITRHLNLVYEALIAEVDRYRGSVIGFAGDAITCWFAENQDANGALPEARDGAVLRAATCALQMQQAMRDFARVDTPAGAPVQLALKVLVAGGQVQRMVVGDPRIQRLDLMTGAPLAQVALGEGLARKHEVLVDEAAGAVLGRCATLGAWRTAPGSAARFAPLQALAAGAAPAPWPAPQRALQDEQVRPWLLPAVHERLRDGLGEFLSELRPATVLFARFACPAGGAAPLDAYIRWVQGVVTHYEGILAGVIIGDKGSYLYAAFGAPLAHEDDARRAASAAIELCVAAPGTGIPAPQIGVNAGTVRAGAYGSTTRRTYGVLGDAVNTAARLMQAAAPGEVLASGRARRAAGGEFAWQSLPALQVKGKRSLLRVERLAGWAPAGNPTPAFSGVLVGREEELARLALWLSPVLEQRCAGLIGVWGDPGSGKSRLLYEMRRRFGAAEWFVCPADGILHQSLHPFRHFLRGYFDQRAGDAVEANYARFERILEAHLAEWPDPQRTQLERARSVLAAWLDLGSPGSLYEQLDPALRFENMLATFKALVLAHSTLRPVVLHLEDAHWLDADSLQMARALLHNAADYPLAIVASARYRDDGGRVEIETGDDVARHDLDLGALSAQGVRALAEQVLGLGHALHEQVLAFVMEKTGGNALFVEQLVLDLRERGAVRLREGMWKWEGGVAGDEHAASVPASESGSVPASISTVLIARLDRLAAPVRAVVQTASVLGDEFDVRVLSRMLSDVDAERLLPHVREAEAGRIWAALGRMRYAFVHSLLRDTAYGMQVHARLRELHALAAAAIEQLADGPVPYYADLVHHYRCAGDAPAERRCALLAGEQSAAHFANAEAVRYYTRALELMAPGECDARYAALFARERVFELQGSRDDQLQDLEALQQLASALSERERAAVALRRANYAYITGDYPGAVAAARAAIEPARAAGALDGEAEAYRQWGAALAHQAAYAEAREHFERALALYRQNGTPGGESLALSDLGVMAFEQGDCPTAHAYLERALALFRQAGDRRGESSALNNLGLVARMLRDYVAARAYQEQALALFRTLGDRRGESMTLNNLGNVARNTGDYAAARVCQEAALQLDRELGDRRGESIALTNLGLIAWALGAQHEALDYFERSLRSKRALGDRRGEGIAQGCRASVLDALGRYDDARACYDDALRIAREIGDRRGEGSVLAGVGLLEHHLERHEAARECARRALAIAQELNDPAGQGDAACLLGHALAALGDPNGAREAYLRALDVRDGVEQAALAHEARAGLARLALAGGDVPGALALVEPILPALANGLAGATEPERVRRTCEEVLRAAGRVLPDRRAALE